MKISKNRVLFKEGLHEFEKSTETKISKTAAINILELISPVVVKAVNLII